MEQKILIFKFLITFFLFFYSSVCFSKKIIEGKVKIIDGDTIHIGNNKIRLHGIDAPEINQTCTINKINWDKINILFTALPNGEAQRLAAYIPKKIKIIDLSADFRLNSPESYKRWYGKNHKCKDLISLKYCSRKVPITSNPKVIAKVLELSIFSALLLESFFF